MFSVEYEETLAEKGYYTNIVLVVLVVDLRDHAPGFSLMLAPSSPVDWLCRFFY